MINKLIMDALKPLNIPLSFQKYSGKAEIYITFHEYMTLGEEYEDDDEMLTGHYIQIDLWTKSDYTELVKRVRSALLSAGFKRLNETDLYEEDTKIYHKVMRFHYLEERREQ